MRLNAARAAASSLLVILVLASPARAQESGQPWIAAGGGSATLLGDCTNCEADTYLHSWSVVANAGVSLNKRTDVGVELFWVPADLATGDRIKVTFLLAAAQFRPWQNHGFFLKTGLGMAFLRNWLDVFEPQSPPLRSKAFALDLGTGWEWRVSPRVGLEIYGAQHVAALGDLQTSEATAENVMGNFWSVGTAIVIR